MKRLWVVVFLLALPNLLLAQSVGQLLVESVHGQGLEHTSSGESPDRTVAVYLPPSYHQSPDRRYPTIYLLHGIEDTEKEWTRAWNDPDDPWGTVERLMNQGIAGGSLKEMIVIMPDQRTRAAGSFYVNSSVTGQWEDFTARELVKWADTRFRTLDQTNSRGIAGHSMGGYGAIVIGMKYPDVFSVVYAMNPGILGWAGDLSTENPAFRGILERTSWDQIQGFYEAAIICLGQAFSPNPDRPPFFADFPFRLEDGELVPNGSVHAAWEARFPANMAPHYRENLLKLKGLRFDSGYEDEFTHIPPTSRALSKTLTNLQIPHVFEEYNGDHRNRLWGPTGRLYTEVLPWFSLLLQAE